MGHRSRTTILALARVAHTPERSTALLVVAVVVEHDARQLALPFGERPTLRPLARVIDVEPVAEIARAS